MTRFRALLLVLVWGAVVPGCNRTPPAPPSMTPETQAAIQAEDQQVEDAERAQAGSAQR
ncbi:MAG: hypothetical protein GYA33_06185 [Thermogutta sp.]|nr:hypothetical protein [Thermogutta sp.]